MPKEKFIDIVFFDYTIIPSDINLKPLQHRNIYVL